jgi:hypothetical protein
MVRFDVLDGGVEVLLREAQPDAGRPLAAKFYYGAGEVFHSLTSHLTSKVGEQGGTSFQSLGVRPNNRYYPSCRSRHSQNIYPFQ